MLYVAFIAYYHPDKLTSTTAGTEKPANEDRHSPPTRRPLLTSGTIASVGSAGDHFGRPLICKQTLAKKTGTIHL